MMRPTVMGVTTVLLVGAASCKYQAAAPPTLKPTGSGTAIVESSGGKQIGIAGMVLKDPLVVQVNDDKGTAVAAALVEFHGPSGVHFEPAALLTDSSGQATTAVTLGSIAGRYQLNAVTPGKSQPVTVQIVETALGYQQQLGFLLAEKYCDSCHDPESSPERVSNYDNLLVKPHPFTEGGTLNKMSDADLTAIIQHGGPGLNRSALMPPYGDTLSLADMRALIAYMRMVADPPYEPAGIVYARK
ncbi:MAG: c-type cytochrome [Silvibacterium sp.]